MSPAALPAEALDAVRQGLAGAAEGAAAAGMPRPESDTSTTTRSPSRRAAMRIS